MPAPTPVAPTTTQSCQVYAAADFAVVLGANQNLGVSTIAELNPGDIYGLLAHAAPLILVHAGHDDLTDVQAIAPGSQVGQEGQPIEMSGRITMMGDDGMLVEILLLRCAEELFLRPLAALKPRTEYTLIHVDAQSGKMDLAEIACVSFTRGTQISMANGAQRRVEDLAIGDRVLTRDHGPRPIRWIGAQTVRAVGAFAPVFISKGAMNNAEDLILSPDHRLFIYQRRDEIGLGRQEVLVKAKYLVNGETIYQRDGGFVDYFHLLLDEHEIIFAEGIAAESLMVNSHTLAAMPGDLAEEVTASHGALAQTARRGTEPEALDLEGMDLAELLRRASGH